KIGTPILGIYPAGGADLHQLIYCDELAILDVVDLNEQFNSFKKESGLDDDGKFPQPLKFSKEFAAKLRRITDETIQKITSTGYDYFLKAQQETILIMLSHILLLGASLE